MQKDWTNSFQEVLEAVLFGGWSIPPTAHSWLLWGSATTLSSSDLLSGVPPRHHQTSGWTHHKGRINHKISHLMCLFMAGPILMDLITPHPCPSLILMTYWGEPFSYLWMRMGRERGLPFLNMSRISINNKSPNKISSDSSSRLMEINLMTSFHITNLWNT